MPDRSRTKIQTRSPHPTRRSRLDRVLGRRRGGPRQVPWILVLPSLALVLAYVAGTASGAFYAFTSWNGLSNPQWIGLGNFREIFHTSTTSTAFWNTLKLAGADVILVNILGLSLALGLNKAVKSRYLLRSLFFLPVAVSSLAVAYIWQYIFDYNGALNRILDFVGLGSWKHPWLGDPHWALWTILVVLLWQFSGVTMVIYLAGLQSIPEELEEAASVDGASAWMRFRRITLPLLAPAITVNGTLTLIFSLRVFDQIMALTGGGPVDASESLATQVYKQTFVYGRFGYGAALALILTGLVTVMGIAQMTILRAREARM